MSAREELSTFLATCSRESLLQAFGQPLLAGIFPGIHRILVCDQGPFVHLEGNVAIHTALVFQNLFPVSRQRLGRDPDFIERLACVWHDGCKPDTRFVDTDGSVSFPGHEAMAATMVPKIAASLSLSELEESKLHYMIANHGIVHSYPGLSPEQRAEISSSPWIRSLAVLQEADAKSCILPGGGHLPVYSELMLADADSLVAAK
ncbi:MAG: hypothetical protein K1X79_14280 [Oligoflexia bacterium]|nr:hypothetical protein [Oligoflexia bacterium]